MEYEVRVRHFRLPDLEVYIVPHAWNASVEEPPTGYCANTYACATRHPVTADVARTTPEIMK